jgi:hypothetical protein
MIAYVMVGTNDLDSAVKFYDCCFTFLREEQEKTQNGKS